MNGKFSITLDKSCMKTLEETANALYNSYLETAAYITSDLYENSTEDTIEADKETIEEQKNMAEIWKKIADACTNSKEV